MSNPLESSPSVTPPARRSFWRRRFVEPVLAQLKQGTTPDKLAATVAVGTACSLFPFLGLTTSLNLVVGLWLRMNQPLLQTLNYALSPLHLVMIVAYVRLGEGIWRAGDARFSVAELIRAAREDTAREFLQRFGWAGVHAFTAWALSAPLIVAGLYYGLRPALRRLSALRAGPRAPERA